MKLQVQLRLAEHDTMTYRMPNAIKTAQRPPWLSCNSPADYFERTRDQKIKNGANNENCTR